MKTFKWNIASERVVMNISFQSGPSEGARNFSFSMAVHYSLGGQIDTSSRQTQFLKDYQHFWFFHAYGIFIFFFKKHIMGITRYETLKMYWSKGGRTWGPSIFTQRID